MNWESEHQQEARMPHPPHTTPRSGRAGFAASWKWVHVNPRRKDGEKMTEQLERRTAIGLAWYRSDEWEELKAFCDDRSTLEESYDEWKNNAEKARGDLESTATMWR